MTEQEEQVYSRKARLDEGKTGRKKKKGWKAWLLSLILIVLLGAVAWAGYLYTQYKGSIDDLHKEAKGFKGERNVSRLIAQGKPFSILLLGTDTGDLGRDRTGLTDSMMLVTINPKDGKTTMVSIPRDIMVAIPGHEDTFPQKLNAAFSIDGVGATMQTVQDYLNVPVDSYALINMGGLTTLINQVGGVSVKSPLSFQYSQATAHDYGPDLYRFHKDSTAYEYSSDNGETWSETKHKLTGDAALAFSRMRYDDPQGDYGRQQRQRIILEALIKKALNVQNLLNPGFIKKVAKNAETDLTFSDMTKLAQKYRNAGKTQDSDHLQGIGNYYGGVSYQMVKTSEKQRVTDKLRGQLGLKAKETGSQYAGEVPTEQVRAASDNLAEIGEKLS
ncbi:LCP family protein [Leuconostocaceae bacterium ESL0958]|nr:LCP family protein [Leuconostocaceae bacterium ESL0958]